MYKLNAFPWFLRTCNEPNEIHVFEDHCEMLLYDGKSKIPSGEKTVFDVDILPLVRKRKWHKNVNGYAASHQVSLGDTRPLFLHHLVLPKQDGYITDHKDGNKLDNRRDNLRRCTHAQNLQNTALNYGAVPYKGVSIDRSTRTMNKYRPHIECCGVRYDGPRCFTAEEADIWVRLKREQLHGQFTNHGDVLVTSKLQT